LASDLQKKADLLGIGQRVTFTGKMSQADLFFQYHKFDLLLFPSLHDSSGNVILESFANGLPVLCLNLGGPGEMVDDTCGRAIDVKGINQEAVISRLADSLVEFANSPELMQHFRDGAQARAIASTWDAAVNSVYVPVEKSLI
jgi:glycosyltransferase involved in cell wall biosynthesis